MHTAPFAPFEVTTTEARCILGNATPNASVCLLGRGCHLVARLGLDEVVLAQSRLDTHVAEASMQSHHMDERLNVHV